MPILAPPARAPYAYVVDYRALDACAPPACRIAGEKLEGWWDEVQNDGGRGDYARIGDRRNEVYFRRSKVLRKSQSYEFELAPETGEFDYDGYFAALGGLEWQARFEVLGAEGKVLYAQDFEGATKQTIDAGTVPEMARYEDYFSHVRTGVARAQHRLVQRNLALLFWIVRGSGDPLRRRVRRSAARHASARGRTDIGGRGVAAPGACFRRATRAAEHQNLRHRRPPIRA